MTTMSVKRDDSTHPEEHVASHQESKQSKQQGNNDPNFPFNRALTPFQLKKALNHESIKKTPQPNKSVSKKLPFLQIDVEEANNDDRTPLPVKMHFPDSSASSEDIHPDIPYQVVKHPANDNILSSIEKEMNSLKKQVDELAFKHIRESKLLQDYEHQKALLLAEEENEQLIKESQQVPDKQISNMSEEELIEALHRIQQEKKKNEPDVSKAQRSRATSAKKERSPQKRPSSSIAPNRPTQKQSQEEKKPIHNRTNSAVTRKDSRQYKEKFVEYKTHKKQDQATRRSGSPKDIPRFDVYKSTSPNPQRRQAQSKWDPQNYPEYRKQLLAKKSGKQHVTPSKSPNEHKLPGRQSSLRKSVDKGQSAPKGVQEFQEQNVFPHRLPEPKLSEAEDLDDYERKLLQWVFSLFDKGNSGFVEKRHIGYFIRESSEILELYGLDKNYVEEDLANFETIQPGYLRYTELLKFLGVTSFEAEKSPQKKSESREVAQKPAKLQSSPSKRAANELVLSPEIMETMKHIFKELDKYDDGIVSRKALIKSIEKDSLLEQHFFLPAICVNEVGRFISFGRLLNQILIEEEVCSPEQKTKVEYISLQDFVNKFADYKTPSKQVLLKEAQRLEDEILNTIEVYSDYEWIVANNLISSYKTIFSKLQKHAAVYVATEDFLKEISDEGIIKRLQDLKIGYLEWLDVLELIMDKIQRDRMNNIDNSDREGLRRKLADEFEPENSVELKRSTINQLPPDNQVQDTDVGIISEPEDDIDEVIETDRPYDPSSYLSPKNTNIPEKNPKLAEIISEHKKTPSREEAIARKHQIVSESKIPTSQMLDMFKRDTLRADEKITIPQPFEFEAREANHKDWISKKKFEEMIESVKMKENKWNGYNFQARPVPKSTSEPKFGMIMYEQELKKKYIKDHLSELTQIKQKPFSFYYRDYYKDFKPKPKPNPKPRASVSRTMENSITISQRNSINDSALMKKAAAENMEDSLESKLKKLDEELALHQSMLVKRG